MDRVIPSSTFSLYHHSYSSSSSNPTPSFLPPKPNKPSISSSPQNPNHSTPLWLCNASKKPSFVDQILDYIEGGPKLRKWYGAPELLPKDGLTTEEEDEIDVDEDRDAVLVTDGDSDIGQIEKRPPYSTGESSARPQPARNGRNENEKGKGEEPAT